MERTRKVEWERKQVVFVEGHSGSGERASDERAGAETRAEGARARARAVGRGTGERAGEARRERRVKWAEEKCKRAAVGTRQQEEDDDGVARSRGGRLHVADARARHRRELGVCRAEEL